jgi:hypothetical protein
VLHNNRSGELERESGRLSVAIRPAVLAFVFLLGLPGRSLVDEATAAERSQAPEYTFAGVQLDGTKVTGRLTGLTPRPAFVMALPDGATRELPFSEVFRLSRETSAGSDTKEMAEGPFLQLPDGDRMMGLSIGSADEMALEVQSGSLGKLKVPLESILSLAFAPPQPREEFDALADRLRQEPRRSEVLWMANGDRQAGGFLGLDDRKVKFQLDAGAVEIDRAGLIALGFDPKLVRYPRPEGDFVEVGLRDGTRLGISDGRLDQGFLEGKTRFGESVRFGMADVVSLEPRTASFDFLADREVAAAQYVPYVGPVRPFRVDRNVLGQRFQLAGVLYERGIGTQSRTLLAYKLKPGDRRFQALVGLDDRAGPLGHVVFRVLVDGQERFASPGMACRATPQAVDVDLSGAKLLILITEFGERGDVRDLADWVDARILH